AVARGRTVPSPHAYFLRPGDPKVQILYDVDRIRDGRSFTTRRVVAIQHGRAIFNMSAAFHPPALQHVSAVFSMSASFHRDERGLEHHLPMPEVTAADDLPTFQERWEPWKEKLGDWYNRPRPIDTRPGDWDPPP